MNIIASAYENMWKLVKIMDGRRMSKQTLTPNVTIIKDIPYINDNEPDHMLDIYYPEGTVGALPVIIDIHGGGFMYGNKELNIHYSYYLASLGFTVIGVNYRLCKEFTLVEAVKDVMAAFKWIGENGQNYCCDLNNLFVTGDSAGGFLAAYCALVNSSGELLKVFGAEKTNLDIKAIGLTSAVFRLNHKIIRTMRKSFLGDDYKSQKYFEYFDFKKAMAIGKMPPSYIVTSDGDGLKGESKWMKDQLKKRGIDCRYHKWGKDENGKSLSHVFSILFPLKFESQSTMNEMISFFKSYMK